MVFRKTGREACDSVVPEDICSCVSIVSTPRFHQLFRFPTWPLGSWVYNDALTTYRPCQFCQLAWFQAFSSWREWMVFLIYCLTLRRFWGHGLVKVYSSTSSKKDSVSLMFASLASYPWKHIFTHRLDLSVWYSCINAVVN